MQWLADTLFHAHAADEYPVFVIQNAEVLGMFGWNRATGNISVLASSHRS